MVTFELDPHGELMAVTPGGPLRDRPRDWLVWHMTHIENLDSIAQMGEIRSTSHAPPHVNIANLDVKAARESVAVNLASNYPPGVSVADHVPFYFAARSPMQFAIAQGHQNFVDGNDSLVFLGVTIERIVAAGLTWCASDRNASLATAAFTSDMNGLGSFIDYSLMLERQWASTDQDLDRSSRRAAEFLVISSIPVSEISLLVVKDPTMLALATEAFTNVSGNRQYVEGPGFYFARKESDES